jgi:hypothetical protein
MLSNVELDSIVMAKRGNNDFIQIDTTRLYRDIRNFKSSIPKTRSSDIN